MVLIPYLLSNVYSPCLFHTPQSREALISNIHCSLGTLPSTLGNDHRSSSTDNTEALFPWLSHLSIIPPKTYSYLTLSLFFFLALRTKAFRFLSQPLYLSTWSHHCLLLWELAWYPQIADAQKLFWMNNGSCSINSLPFISRLLSLSLYVWSNNFLSVTISFMCQLGWVIVPSYLIKLLTFHVRFCRKPSNMGHHTFYSLSIGQYL